MQKPVAMSSQTCSASMLPSKTHQLSARSRACAKLYHNTVTAGSILSRNPSSWEVQRSSLAAFQQRCNRRKMQRSGARLASTTVSEAATKVPVADRLEGDDLDRWQACVQMMVEVGVPPEDAEKLLAKAFGWRGQGYWRKNKVDEVPQPELVEGVLAFLAEQGVGGDDLIPALTRFPEVLALSVESQLQGNVATLQSEWFVRGLALKKLLRTQPQVLGYTVNCGGDCKGDCNRCWVRF